MSLAKSRKTCLTNITSPLGSNIILDALPAASERVFYRAYSQ